MLSKAVVGGAIGAGLGAIIGSTICVEEPLYYVGGTLIGVALGALGGRFAQAWPLNPKLEKTQVVALAMIGVGALLASYALWNAIIDSSYKSALLEDSSQGDPRGIGQQVAEEISRRVKEGTLPSPIGIGQQVAEEISRRVKQGSPPIQ